MRNVIWDLTFIYDMLHKSGPAVALGGILVIAIGLMIGKYSMVIAGAVVTLIVALDYVVMFFFGKRNDG
ncbi:MAG: hypothetical protein JNL64_10250 [Blastocatellia bacterium]|nr:hypothetical protein [Blastocatellia bacterium]